MHSERSLIAQASFHGYHISMAARDGATTFWGDLESLEVVDYHTKETKFPTLISTSPSHRRALACLLASQLYR